MRAAAPGARFWISTSARRSSLSRMTVASGCFRSSDRLSLERLVHTKCDDMPFTRLSYARDGSPTSGRSILIMRAPRSASCRVQKGPAITCSRATTVIPSKGRIRSHSGQKALLALERARHAEHVLSDIRQNQVGRDRRHLIQARLAEFALHVVLAREAEAAVKLQAGVRGFPGCLGSQIFRHVGLSTAGPMRIEQLAGAPTHKVRGFDLDEGFGNRELHALVLRDGTPEHDAILGVFRDAVDKPVTIADALGRD